MNERVERYKAGFRDERITEGAYLVIHEPTYGVLFNAPFFAEEVRTRLKRCSMPSLFENTAVICRPAGDLSAHSPASHGKI